MIHAISVGMKGDVHALPGERFDMAPGLGVLADSEKDVLVEISEGLKNKDIASRLGLDVREVEAHRRRLMVKLRIRGAAQLTHFAISQGLIALDDMGLNKNIIP